MAFQKKHRSLPAPTPTGKRDEPLNFRILRRATKHSKRAMSISGQSRGLISRIGESLGFSSLPPRAKIEKVEISSRRTQKP